MLGRQHTLHHTQKLPRPQVCQPHHSQQALSHVLATTITPQYQLHLLPVLVRLFMSRVFQRTAGGSDLHFQPVKELGQPAIFILLPLVEGWRKWRSRGPAIAWGKAASRTTEIGPSASRRAARVLVRAERHAGAGVGVGVSSRHIEEPRPWWWRWSMGTTAPCWRHWWPPPPDW